MFCAYKHIPSNKYIVLYKESDAVSFKCLMNNIVHQTRFFHKLFSESWAISERAVDIKGYNHFNGFELIFETPTMDREYLKANFPHLFIII